uniref:Uncharacterized protein n=1 Tax=Anguilla anguilla TaxID=7936 RepID=A0A0E9QYB1_ANGAN
MLSLHMKKLCCFVCQIYSIDSEWARLLKVTHL